MRILVPMTYYRPYVSGPIVYMDNLGAELARRGHRVTFLTSRHDPASCPQGPNGLRVERARVWARLSKGVVMPGFLPLAARLLREHDLLLIQLPQLEAPALAALARAVRKPAILTWHCDVQLPSGLLTRAIERVLAAGAGLATRLSTRVVAYTEDYARHSPVLSRALEKVEVIPPPVELAPPAPGAAAEFRRALGLEDSRAIGICGRMSNEKGFERLLDALPAIRTRFPNVVVLHAGEAREVAGESAYRQRLQPRIAGQGTRWRSLGVLGKHELAAFYAACDVTVLPSLNRTESFGLVQVESMLSGTPVVASALPGVRVPIAVTGMGITAPPGDTGALAEAIVTVLESPDRYRRPRSAIEAEYSVARTADGYEHLLCHLSHLPRATCPERA